MSYSLRGSKYKQTLCMQELFESPTTSQHWHKAIGTVMRTAPNPATLLGRSRRSGRAGQKETNAMRRERPWAVTILYTMANGQLLPYSISLVLSLLRRALIVLLLSSSTLSLLCERSRQGFTEGLESTLIANTHFLLQRMRKTRNAFPNQCFSQIYTTMVDISRFNNTYLSVPNSCSLLIKYPESLF